VKVEFVYRNYIPLYPHYFSFEKLPVADIEIVIPCPRPSLQRYYKFYRHIKRIPFVSGLVNVSQKALFREGHDPAADLYFFIGMLPSKVPDRPYIVDLEHANSLMNFSESSEKSKRNILTMLEHPLCKFIVPWSYAAENSLKLLLGKGYEQIGHKVEVVYPAIACHHDTHPQRLSTASQAQRFLFIGRDGPRKGLHELLTAFDVVSNKADVALTVISSGAQKLASQYGSNNKIAFFNSNFSLSELVSRFYMESDCFVFPTLADTFGLVLLESMSCGVPVVTTRQFASPEIVDHEVDGMLLNNEPLFLDRPSGSTIHGESEYTLGSFARKQLVEELIWSLNRFVTEQQLGRHLGENTLKKFRPGGRFSLATRNAKLKRIFVEALS
jgi:glycosyltransferase involved in cell wall biosynthesis